MLSTSVYKAINILPDSYSKPVRLFHLPNEEYEAQKSSAASPDLHRYYVEESEIHSNLFNPIL